MAQIIDLATFQFEDSKLIASIANIQKSLLELKTKVADNNKEYKNNQQSINLLIASQNAMAVSGNKNTEAYRANEKSLNDLNNSQNKLLQNNAVLTNNIVGLNGNLREQQTALASISQAASGTETPYKNLNAEMNKMKTEAKNLGAELIILEREGKKGTAEYTELEKKFKQTSESASALDKQFKALDGTVGDNQRNVGNYSESIVKAYNELENQKKSLIENKTELESQISKLENLTASVNENSDEYRANIQMINLFVTQINILNAEISNVDKSMSKATGAMNTNAGATKNLADNQISLRAQLRNAKQEVAELSEKYGANSIEAINAAKKAAQLADAFGDSNALINAFNPDAKFKALTASLSGVAGGFGAVQGAISLMGVESEEVQKQLLKVQSAMAISQGLQDVGESIDSFKQLGAVIKNTSFVQGILNFVKTGSLKIQKEEIVSTAVAATSQTALATATAGTATATTFATLATKAFRIALIATGIGAVVVGLGLLISNFTAVKNAVYNAVPGLRVFGNFMSSIVNKITDFVGATSEASRELDGLKKSADKSLSINKKFLQEHGDQIDEYTKKKIEANNEYFEAIKEEGADVKALRDRANREIAKADDDRNKDIAEKRKKANDDAESEFKKAEDKRKQQAKEIEDAQKKEIEAQITNDKELANAQIETAKLSLASYLIDNQSKLTDAKRLTEALIAEEKKRLEAVYQKNQDIIVNETIAKQKQLDIEINALKNKQGQLTESEKTHLADLQQQKTNNVIESNNKEKELFDNHKKSLNELDKNFENQKSEENKIKRAQEFQLLLTEMETNGATEEQIKNIQLDREKEIELQKLKEKEDAKFLQNVEQRLAQDALLTEEQAIKDELNLQLQTTKDDSEKVRIQNQLDAINILEKNASDKKTELSKIETEARLNAYGSMFGNIATLLGKDTVAGKAAAIAQVGISQGLAIARIWEQKSILPSPFGVIAKAAETGIAIANTAQALSKINSVQGFATGGIITDGQPISRRNGDDVLITAKRGEVILNQTQQAMLGGATTFSSIGVPGFATGGVVGSNIASVQNSITNQLDLSMLAETIGKAVFDGANTGTANGSQKGIIGLSENRQIANNANF